MHDVVKVERGTLDELLCYRENYIMLKKEIESLYNALMCCEVNLPQNNIEEDIEAIEEI